MSPANSAARAPRQRQQQRRRRGNHAAAAANAALLLLALLLALAAQPAAAAAGARALTAELPRFPPPQKPMRASEAAADAPSHGGALGVGEVGTRVVGGLDAPQERLSFQLGMRVGPGGGYICGGALVAGHVALTAAHCQARAQGATNYAAAGAYTRAWMTSPPAATGYVARAMNHPYNNQRKFTYDATLAFLDRCPASEPGATGAIAPIQIATPEGAQRRRRRRRCWRRQGGRAGEGCVGWPDLLVCTPVCCFCFCCPQRARASPLP